VNGERASSAQVTMGSPQVVENIQINPKILFVQGNADKMLFQGFGLRITKKASRVLLIFLKSVRAPVGK